MNDTIKQLRATIIALLDDEEGIVANGYTELQTLANTVSEGTTDDIFALAESAGGRYFLPEDHGLTP